jgi:ribosomal protein S14
MKTTKLLINISFRELISNFEIRRKVLRVLLYSFFKFSLYERLFFQGCFYMFLTKSSKVFCKNICILTGRSRGVRRYFRISRIKFRDFYSVTQNLYGLRKSSW